MATDGNGSRGRGRVLRVIGPVVDVEFAPTDLPEINTGLTVERTLAGETTTITMEVAQHIGENAVRAVAMRPTDGLVRGAPVENLGEPLAIPVGQQTLGHVFNVLGVALDAPEESFDLRWPIHRE
ncbi:MAG TPA: F0F1 ATP synthase subunit beta, partial [Actinomycetota bacterium]|nr:F0F1 ATP synthase subunit beta [Actinomycetota bacterium]